jgi:DNA-binding NarL/FixJ family response regulator
MQTRKVYLANLPKLLQEVVQQLFESDSLIQVVSFESADMSEIMHIKQIDLLMLPLAFKTKNQLEVNTFLQLNPCARVLFISPEVNALHIMELKVEHRLIKSASPEILSEIVHSFSDLCEQSTSIRGLN